MKVIPKWDRVLLKRESLAKDSILIIPEKIEKANQSERGIVVAVGPTAGVWKDGHRIATVEVGEHVVFAKHAGIEVKVEGESFWLVHDQDIHASFVEPIQASPVPPGPRGWGSYSPADEPNV